MTGQAGLQGANSKLFYEFTRIAHGLSSVLCNQKTTEVQRATLKADQIKRAQAKQRAQAELIAQAKQPAKNNNREKQFRITCPNCKSAIKLTGSHLEGQTLEV